MQVSKKHWIYIIVTVGFIAQIFLSQKLWYGETRQFFLIPMFESLPLIIGNTGNMVLFIGLLLSLIIGIFYHNRYLIGGIILFLTLLFLQDLTRIQAWSYQYFLTFLILLVDWKKPTREMLPALQFILIFTYFWSGIQKINPHYVESVHPWLFSAFDWTEAFANNIYLGYAAAIIEALIGIGLLFRKTRRIAVFAGILMHLFILSMISPLGLNWNSVVYPWNIVMICLLPILFWGKKESSSSREIGVTPKSPIQWLVLVCLGVFPLFNLLAHFPETISMTMYNGVTSEITVYFATVEKPNCIPEEAKIDIYPVLNGNILSLDDWGIQELNVPIYALPTYVQKFGKQFCDCIQNDVNAGIKITYTKRWTTEDDKIIDWISCQDLK